MASAAYRSGEKLYSEYYGEYSDYTKKGGVLLTEILLPPNAPAEYSDRQTLWNAVENAERGKKAQLAYSFDIALQNEFSLEENIALARQFLLEQFVSRGMIVDFAVHDPDKSEIDNPHFHFLCPIRPLKEDGSWDAKQHRVYELDAQGNRIPDGKGGYKFNAVATTDWGTPETLEHWREQWAVINNAMFEKKNLSCRIDHRSYERQGLDILPTVHEGPAVRQMEARGIKTEKAALNRWIRKTNEVLKELRQKFSDLAEWIRIAKEELEKPQSPMLIDFLSQYYSTRNAGAYSNKAKVNNLKAQAETVIYLQEKRLFTLDDLETYVKIRKEKATELLDATKLQEARMKELKELIRLAGVYKDNRPVYDEYRSIHRAKKKEVFQEEHRSQLSLYQMAQRKLKPHTGTDGILPINLWKSELADLETAHVQTYERSYKPLKAELAELQKIQKAIETVRSSQEQTQNKRRKHDYEL